MSTKVYSKNTLAGMLRDAADRLEELPKHPQDMSLRELFDHVAIVNDAVRAALAGHPGCEPAKRYADT